MVALTEARWPVPAIAAHCRMTEYTTARIRDRAIGAVIPSLITRSVA